MVFLLHHLSSSSNEVVASQGGGNHHVEPNGYHQSCLLPYGCFKMTKHVAFSYSSGRCSSPTCSPWTLCSGPALLPRELRPVCLKHPELPLWSTESQPTWPAIDPSSVPSHAGKLTLGGSNTHPALHLLGQRVCLSLTWDIFVSWLPWFGFQSVPHSTPEESDPRESPQTPKIK